VSAAGVATPSTFSQGSKDDSRNIHIFKMHF
jgi:hypothetical protein